MEIEIIMKDLKAQILDKYKYKFEFHAHTSPVSACSELPVDVFTRNFIENGYDGVVITNHFLPSMKDDFTAKECAEFYLSDYHAVKKEAGDKLSVCLGMEIRFKGSINDYLVYGINEDDVEKCWYYLDKDIDTFYKEFKNDKNIILQAHPFRDDMTRCNPKSIDGIEVFNLHPAHNARIAVAGHYAQENGLLVSGGLDYHHQFQTDLTSVRLPSLAKDSYDIADLLKKEDMIFTVGNSIILP